MRFKHLLLPALSALASLAAFFPAGIAAMGPITFLLITLGTVLLSTYLLQHEFRQQPQLPQPLSSPAQPLSATGKIRGGDFTSLFTFTGNLIAILLAGLTDPKILLALSWLNVLVVPYVLFAVWYQRSAVRQWCIGYLGLAVVLADAPLMAPDVPLVPKITVLLILPLLATRLQVRTYRENQQNLRSRNVILLDQPKHEGPRDPHAND